MAIKKQLIVDENHPFFTANEHKFMEYPSNIKNLKTIVKNIMEKIDERFKNDNLLFYQLMEIIKNAIEHGNKKDPNKKVKIGVLCRENLLSIIVEDQGNGFTNIEDWNRFYELRQEKLSETVNITDESDEYASFHSIEELERLNTGGVGLCSAIEYWNKGIIYNERKNKVLLIKEY